MNALVIGYGSIGRRHTSVLDRMGIEVDIVSKQNLDRRTFKRISEIEELHIYDYIIVASETYKHYEQLKFLEENLKGKVIFCEKPLFEKYMDFTIRNNQVFVGYVLRFHPLIEELKKVVENEKVYFVEVNCNSYLPNWRKNIDYRNSYSADKNRGGGVLLDLSHELDYIIYLFGTLTEIKSFQNKVSELEINSDDIVILNANTNKNIKINLTLGYFSKIDRREIVIHSNNYSIKLDFIDDSLKIIDSFGKEELKKIEKLDRDYMFQSMHEDILGDKKSACNYEEAKEVMKTIMAIQEQNK